MEKEAGRLVKNEDGVTYKEMEAKKRERRERSCCSLFSGETAVERAAKCVGQSENKEWQKSELRQSWAFCFAIFFYRNYKINCK